MTAPTVTYGFWEGDPIAFAEYPDGRSKALIHLGGVWREANPADIFTRASIVREAPFRRECPNLELPTFPE